MKILLCAGAVVLLLAGSATAKPAVAGAKQQAHKYGTIQKTRPARLHRAPQKDPWAAYWNDQSRYEFPSWGLRGGW